MRRKLDEVARFTTQPRALADFYATLLDEPLPAGDDAISFDIDGVTLLIHATDGSPPQPGWPLDVDHVAFRVDDLDAECERIRAAGFEIIGPTDLPWGRSAYLHDPDGRLVELHA